MLLLRSRITLVWLLLVGATALSWEIGHGFDFVEGVFNDERYAAIAIIVVAFIKARYVILDFMDIRHAPRAARFVGEAWGLLACAVLIVLYLRAGQ